MDLLSTYINYITIDYFDNERKFFNRRWIWKEYCYKANELFEVDDDYNVVLVFQSMNHYSWLFSFYK